MRYGRGEARKPFSLETKCLSWELSSYPLKLRLCPPPPSNIDYGSVRVLAPGWAQWSSRMTVLVPLRRGSREGDGKDARALGGSREGDGRDARALGGLAGSRAGKGVSCASFCCRSHCQGVEQTATVTVTLMAVACWSLGRVRLSATPWTVAHQAPLSMEFSRQESWSG